MLLPLLFTASMTPPPPNTVAHVVNSLSGPSSPVSTVVISLYGPSNTVAPVVNSFSGPSSPVSTVVISLYGPSNTVAPVVNSLSGSSHAVSAAVNSRPVPSIVAPVFNSLPCLNRTVSPVANSLPDPSNTVAPLLSSSLAPPILSTLFLTTSQSSLALLLNVVNKLSSLRHCQAYQAGGLSEQLKIVHQNVFYVSTLLSI